MAPKRKAQSTDDNQKKKSAPSLELFLIECEREVALSEFDAKAIAIDVVNESDYDSEDEDEDDRAAMSEQKEIIEFAKGGKELGTWFAADTDGNVLVFSSLDRANEYAQTVWIQMQFEDANDQGLSDDEEDDHPEDFRQDEEDRAGYERERVFVVDPDLNGAKHKFVSATKCRVVQAKHVA